MKKKIILTVAAAAALTVASPLVEKASAAENTTTVQQKVYVYQGSNLNELNSYLEKYFANLGIKVNPNTSTTTQTPVQQPTTTEPTQTTQTTSALSVYEQKVVDLTNQERAKNGLAALKVDTALSKVAREKSLDMSKNGYFSHTSPTYGSPFDMMKQFGVSYQNAGENIAMGQRTPEEVVQAWMNSEGHRKNILNANFNYIGVGYVESGNYWTQMFIGK
ncbi:CAP domain-containing protein [Robertmurraya korlensis]|uniref:CAP domain-containing protein n=1 Tax=Robertmurraya korlensis TaxID=519977 RepID=UPI00203F2DD8|nr:CAP domain-containing protein [Robertmurraya korlensis]MCM3601255.1 CAP domain-containing protein [Robertmurraya korlensis]